MSDAARQSLKVSREGIVLIKSFEGFRPRAIQREDGGWVIGYGHTLSAREGATVSEADAELLLHYDLLPVDKALNESVPGRAEPAPVRRPGQLRLLGRRRPFRRLRRPASA